ncbi:MAG TPA: hypothetical protein PKA13_15425 [Geminicoccaceae bacterium]|nr:hypothetical protein [Geminicoccaceae bacterium]
MEPVNLDKIALSVTDVHKRLAKTRGAISPSKRSTNIKTIKGLIQDEFTPRRDTDILTSSASAVALLNNYLTRAACESSRFELKQGMRNLDNRQQFNDSLLSFIPCIICGIANSNPEYGGMIILGVADSESDAERIKKLWPQTDVEQIGRFHVVGVDHEIRDGIEEYLAKLVGSIRSSALSEPLKSDALRSIDSFVWRGKTIVKINVPTQIEISFLGEDIYYRENSETKKASSRKATELQKIFASRNQRR